MAVAMLLAAGELNGQQQIQVQQIQIQLGIPAAQQYQLTAPQVDVVSGATQARLEQIRALVEQSDEAATRGFLASDGSALNACG